MELIYAIIGILILTLIIHYYLSKSKKQDKLKIESIFIDFQLASKRKDIQEIDRLGKDLIYNLYFTKVHFDVVSKSVESHIEIHTELKELQNLLLNKELFWQGGTGQ